MKIDKNKDSNDLISHKKLPSISLLRVRHVNVCENYVVLDFPSVN